MKIMKKSVLIIVVLILTGGVNLYAQGFNMNRSSNSMYQNMPQEGIFIHQNSTQLFAGEKLYYKVYCLNLKDGNLSDLSKIAYVQLLDSNKNTVFSHKIRLDKGIGASDFALPTDLETGSYKIIGYTSWMQSRKEYQFFESDLIIINPYKVIPENHRFEVETDSISADSLAVPTEKVIADAPQEVILGEKLIKLNLENTEVGTRSRFTVQVEALENAALKGNYSLSVKKIEEALPGAQHTPINFWTDKRRLSVNSASADPIVPELRGELYSGKVVSVDSQQSVEGKKVVLSLPGDPYILDIAQTDRQGNFYFNINTAVNSSEAVFQLLEEDSENYSISLDEGVSPEIGQLEFLPFKIDRSSEAVILERSINNQIENAYAIVKSDTILNPVELAPFYRKYQQQFFLDDYTRFNTLRETMVEIIDNAWISENGEDDPTFGVRPFDGYLESTSLLPIVLVDGLFIRDHKDIVNYNSKEVRSIAISRDRVMLGPQLFQGLVSLNTKAGEFKETFFRSHLINSKLDRPEPYKAYFYQSYTSSEDQSRIPDLRYQLYWDPDLTLGDKRMAEIPFFSSDIKGKFVVELKGYTQTGNPVSLRKTFVVQ